MRSPIGRPVWPWRFVTTHCADRPPRVVLNRYPGQAIGIQFRLPDGQRATGGVTHHGLSVLWAKPW